MVEERNVPKGYKMTEVGVIPENWRVVTFGEAFDFLPTGNNSREEMKTQGIVQYIHYGDIHTKWSYILDCDKNYIPFIDEILVRNLPIIEEGDLIIADASEDYAGIGISIEVKNVRERKIVSGLHTLLLRGDKRIFCDGFKGYIQAMKPVKNQLIKIATGISVYGISKNSLKKVFIPVPTLLEQQAIAEVLSDVDNLIVSLKKLIDKKKKIKQGAMQELLSGRKRLPGFTGKWVVKKLGEIGEIAGAGVDKKIKPNEPKVRLVNYLDVYHKDFIYSNQLTHVVSAPQSKVLKCGVKKGDIYFTPSSETRNDIGLSAVAMEDIPDAVYSYHVVRLRLFDNWDVKFRTYIFKTKFFLEQAETVCEGSGKRYVISLKKFRDLEIMYPADYNEQQAIAQILFNMDSEIEALEQKLEKYKAIKQGMMQELLTGRIRLI